MTQAVGTAGLLPGVREMLRGRKDAPAGKGAGFGDALKGKEPPSGAIRKNDSAATEGQKVPERGWKLAHTLEKLTIPFQRHTGTPPEETGLATGEKDAAAPESEGGAVEREGAALSPTPPVSRQEPVLPHNGAEGISVDLSEGSAEAVHADAQPHRQGEARDIFALQGKEPSAWSVSAGASGPPEQVLPSGAEQQAPKAANARMEQHRAAAADAQLRSAAPTPAQDTGTGAGDAGSGGARDAHRDNTPVRVVGFQSAPAPSPAVNFASNITSAALGSSLATDPGFRAAASEAARAVASGGMRPNQPLHTLKIQLQPAELGAVTARISLAGEQLSIEIQVETAEARQRLGADSDALSRALRALGYEVDRVTVQHTPGNSGANAGSSSASRDAGFQPGSGGSGERGEGHPAGAQREPEGRRQGAGRASAGAGDADPGSDLYI